MKIGIIGAMEIEVEGIIKQMKNVKTFTLNTIDYYEGRIFDVDIVVAKCSPGKVNAAICSQIMIYKFTPSVIINTGVAGGLDPSLNVGDMVIATSLSQHDVDTSAIGDEIGYISGIGMINIPCTEKIVDIIYNSKDDSMEFNLLKGHISTGDSFVCDALRSEWIYKTFNALAVEMEGCAIGQVCYLNNVDFGVIRSISDSADDSADMSYSQFMELASANSISLTLNFIKSYKEKVNK